MTDEHDRPTGGQEVDRTNETIQPTREEGNAVHPRPCRLVAMDQRGKFFGTGPKSEAPFVPGEKPQSLRKPRRHRRPSVGITYRDPHRQLAGPRIFRLALSGDVLVSGDYRRPQDQEIDTQLRRRQAHQCQSSQGATKSMTQVMLVRDRKSTRL